MPNKITGAHLRRGIATLGKYSKRHKQAISRLIFASLFSALALAFVPYISGRLLDILIQGASSGFSNQAILRSFAWLFAIWIIIEFIGVFLQRFIFVKDEEFEAELEADYMTEGFSHLLRLPVRFHKTHKLGEISNRLSRALNALGQILGRIIIGLAPDILSILFALILVFYIEPYVALLLLVMMLIYCGLLLKVAPKLSGISRRMHRAYSEAFGNAYDALTNVLAVKQAAAEEYEKRRLYQGFHLRAAKLWRDYIAIGANLDFAQRSLVLATRAAILLLSLYFIRAGTMTVGELAALNGYAALVFGPLVVIGRNWDILQNGLTAIERAEKILNEEPEIYSPNNPVILSDLKGQIEFRKVSFGYERKNRTVIKDISFTANPGDVVALVGESGVGKSTLVDMISLYNRPKSGMVLIDGHPVTGLDLQVLRSFIAVVPQEPTLFNESIKRNIKYGRFGASDEEIVKAARSAKAHEFIEKFPKKYDQIVGERGIKLSVGQKQRIAIARAILRSPRILILDEPTSALDAQSEKFIQASLEELMKGRTTFIIAHRLSTVRKANKILVLQDGTIAESGIHDELIKKDNGIYRRLYEFQIGLK